MFQLTVLYSSTYHNQLWVSVLKHIMHYFRFLVLELRTLVELTIILHHRNCYYYALLTLLTITDITLLQQMTGRNCKFVVNIQIILLHYYYTWLVHTGSLHSRHIYHCKIRKYTTVKSEINRTYVGDRKDIREMKCEKHFLNT